jgi:serine/threonine protein phosphatase PrpC
MAAASQDEATRVTLDAWLVTDVGVVRDHNEDSAYKEPKRGFFIVADGMGGHAAGEVASAMAVETVKKTLEGATTEIDAFTKKPSDAGRRGLVQLLQSAVLQAHQAVFQRGQAEQDKAGMGTTLDVVLVAGPEAFVAHVGDSRTYLIRDGRTSQITTDHTVAEVLVIEGKLTIEEAQVSPLRTILVNAIGVSADVGVEMAHVTLKRGDRLLLCSDGLHDYFPAEDEIAQRLSAEAPGDALAEMVELAKTRGGHDNITGIAVHILEVVESATTGVEGESTQPVDVPNNPFAQDEPTETALVTPPGVPSRVAAIEISPQSLRQTQPMRALEDEANADTIPPKDKPKTKRDKGSTTEPVDKVDPEEITAPPIAKTEPMYPKAKTEPEAKPEAKPDKKSAKDKDGEAKPDAKADAKPDAKADAKPDAKADAKSDAKADAKSDAKADAKSDVKTDAKTDAKSDAKSDAKADAKSDAKADVKADATGGDATPTEIATADTGRVVADKKPE